MKAFLETVMAVLAFLEAVLGIRTSEEPKYESVRKEGAIEIRAYPELLVAKTVSVDGDKDAGNQNFRILAGYIFGKNKTNEKIGMTAPVFMPDQMKGTGEQVGMTAPVLQSKVDGKQEMIFIMPERYTLETLPQPESDRIELGTIPARTVATIRFSGSAGDDVIKRKSRELLEWVGKAGYEAVSEPVPAYYDPPFALPFLRRNEVYVEVKKAGGE